MFNRAMTAAAVVLLLGACASHKAANTPSSGAATSSNATAGSGTSSSGSASISQSQAQKMLEQDGYSGVKNLRQSGDGGWSGNATANGKPVTVTVSPTGDVRAQ
ncbi:MAG TPA: PepSY domain-containing protein [Stellaceae bacterium]|nr:PepSY domain-containing protein [Stellaceae bacterium]